RNGVKYLHYLTLKRFLVNIRRKKTDLLEQVCFPRAFFQPQVTALHRVFTGSPSCPSGLHLANLTNRL
ncbi:hypothetical protein, partial [Klebsiella pneumoniae]|uniref:hypothetical protein n=1 Tax=Klebsiella pneumoniae TaxID=573 RepID=UPI001A927381